METRNEKFRRLAELRLGRIMQTMNLIANLSAPQYVYTPEDIVELFNMYQTMGKAAQTYFHGPTRYNEMPSNFIFTNTATVASKSITAHDRFRRLAENRMSRILRDLRLLVNLSDKSNYTYSDEEVTELFNAYVNKGRTIAALFAPRDTTFHFKPRD